MRPQRLERPRHRLPHRALQRSGRHRAVQRARRSGVGIWADFEPDQISITDNTTSHNVRDGIRVTDPLGPGRIARNRSWGNANGMFFAAGESSISQWRVVFNEVSHNTRTGMYISGTDNSVFRNNKIVQNGSPDTSLGPTGGIVMRTLPGGDFETADNLVTGNTVRHNTLFDIDADALTATNTITANACGTSTPAGLC